MHFQSLLFDPIMQRANSEIKQYKEIRNKTLIIAIGIQQFGFILLELSLKMIAGTDTDLLMLFSFQCEQKFNFFVVVCFFGGKKISLISFLDIVPDIPQL